MEKEKVRKNVKRECEVVRNRGGKCKTRKRNKYWAQISLGVVLGLLLGFATEFNLLTTTGTAAVNDTSCKFRSGVGLPAPSTMNLHNRYNEDPLKTIKLANSPVVDSDSQDSLVFVGVMTAQKYLSTRAIAVYETWGRELPGRIAFFTSESSRTAFGNEKYLPIVRLRKVDDSYPPQKKSFMMLRYIWENYGDRFEWFVRADDDVYIRPDKLELFLRSIDSRKPLFIGQAGRGNQEEFGLLSLEYDENFCMGGPGIILSRETLRRIAPHIRYCLKNLYTTHEDVELGRCVRKFADISCTWSYEMQTIFYHNSSGFEAFTGNLKRKEVNRAITLHPIKQHQHMYRLHNYMRHLKIENLQHAITLLRRDRKKIAESLTERTSPGWLWKISEEKSLNPEIRKHEPKSEEEVLAWDFIQRSMYSGGNANPRRRIEAPHKEGIENVVGEFMEMINQYSRQRGRVIDYQDLLYGYSRLDPLHGAEYVLDMLLKYKKYRGRKMTVPVRRHAYLHQQFTGLELRDVTEGTSARNEQRKMLKTVGFKGIIEESLRSLRRGLPSLTYLDGETDKSGSPKKIINFVLPLSGRYKTFLRFIENYEEVCLKLDRFTNLVIVMFRNRDEKAAGQIVELVKNLKRKYPESILEVVPVEEDFARAMALEIGASHCRDDESDILFFVDVDVIFGEAALERIRKNTARGRQAYFPIVYSEFDPAVVYGNVSDFTDHFLINSDTGYWRQFGFGIASLYKSDLIRVGSFDTSIRGWGKEDVDLYEKFVSFSGNLTVFRSVDPSLVHVFHVVECDPNLETSQLKMCKGTRKESYGNVDKLARCIYENPTRFEAAIEKKNKLANG